jgi:hypothetical protein
MTKRILIFSLALALASCKPPAPQTKPELPSSLAPAAVFTPAPSVIDVPLEIKTWYLEKLLNDQVNGLLYQCDTLTVAGVRPVRLKVWKGDSIRIALEGNEISYRVPLKLWMQFRFSVGALGFSHTEFQEVDAALALKFKSKYSVKNDWKVVTSTQSDGYEWISAPVLHVRFVSIPVTPIADIILLTQQRSLGAMVDSAVCGSLDLKKMLKPLWTLIQTPILLANAPDSLWLRLSPQSVYMTQLSGTAGTIRGSVGIHSVAETFLGGRPPSNPVDTLPPFTVAEHIDTSFVINLYSEISYVSATQMLAGALKGRSFSSGGNEVIVQDISLYGMQGYAVVSIEFTGSFSGKVYVIGRVTYDPESCTASIDDLEFDITTRNALHSAAGWLFHGVILDKMKPYLRFPLRERLLETQLLVQKMLSHKAISKNLFVTGDIDSLTLGGVAMTEAAIRAVVLARGKLSISAHD